MCENKKKNDSFECDHGRVYCDVVAGEWLTVIFDHCIQLSMQLTCDA